MENFGISSGKFHFGEKFTVDSDCNTVFFTDITDIIEVLCDFISVCNKQVRVFSLNCVKRYRFRTYVEMWTDAMKTNNCSAVFPTLNYWYSVTFREAGTGSLKLGKKGETKRERLRRFGLKSYSRHTTSVTKQMWLNYDRLGKICIATFHRCITDCDLLKTAVCNSNLDRYFR